MHTAARHLVFHASIVLLFGLLLGVPYARAIRRNSAAHVVNSWRVAHLSLPIGATVMFSVAASFLVLGEFQKVMELDPTHPDEMVYAFRGETESAFRWLQASSSLLCPPRVMYASPFLKSLQADARWAQVTARKQ
jgi:hypothetical protein